MEEGITYVGLDAHQETIHAAVRVPGASYRHRARRAGQPTRVIAIADRLALLPPPARSRKDTRDEDP